MKKHILSQSTDHGITTVQVRVPGFANFGQRMDEIEAEHTEAVFDSPLDAVEEGVALVKERAEELDREMQRRVEAGDPMAIQMMGILKACMQELDDDEDDLDGDDEDENEDDLDDLDDEQDESDSPEHLDVSLPEGAAWTEELEARLDDFLADWPRMREDVKRVVFEYYRDNYEEFWEVTGGEPGDKIILPDPTAADALDDLFRFHAIYMHDDGIGLGAFCTWDDEHGLGLRIAADGTIECGHADVAFSEPAH